MVGGAAVRSFSPEVACDFDFDFDFEGAATKQDIHNHTSAVYDLNVASTTTTVVKIPMGGSSVFFSVALVPVSVLSEYFCDRAGKQCKDKELSSMWPSVGCWCSMCYGGVD